MVPWSYRGSPFCRGYDIIPRLHQLPLSPEATLNRAWRHLPFGLVLFIVLFTGLTDVAIGVEPRVLVTLLAPLLWLGLYLLGSERVTREE